MSIDDVTMITREALYTICITAAPVLLVSLTVGLIVSIFQTITSIQEQTLTFLPKLLVILLVIALLGGFMFTSLGEYTIALFNRIPDFAK